MLWFVIIVLVILIAIRSLTRRSPGGIILGVPDFESRRIFWLAKRNKTRLEEMMEWLPQAFVAALISLIMGIVIGATWF